MASSIAFYGDSIGSEVYALDIDRWSLIERIPTGIGPYPVDLVAPNLLFAITRGETSVTPIHTTSLKPGSKINLPHKPRSASNSKDNPKGLVLVSGADQPMTSVVDIVANKVTLTVGRHSNEKPRGFGGALASGHERWADASKHLFFLIDRTNRKVDVYNATSGDLRWSIDSPGPIHHLQPDNKKKFRWFAVCEGDPAAKVPPAIMAIEMDTDSNFSVTDLFFLPIKPSERPKMGSHHADLSPDKRHIYVGSNEGRTFVLAKDSLRHVATLNTGKGAGHTGFLEFDGDIWAVTINHVDKHVSLIDAERHRLIKNIEVTKVAPVGGQRTQGHTTGVRKNFFYMMASLDGDFIEVDVKAGKVTRRLALPRTAPPHNGLPIAMQGTFVWQDPTARTLTDCC